MAQLVEVRDEVGNPVQLTDEYGNPVWLTDEKGNPVYLTAVAIKPRHLPQSNTSITTSVPILNYYSFH
uniref:Uncharacterized protein n=1 Tax=Cajanus cajan TaxID=3821 RepID=A0A151RGL6_CAJCA|nr:hypothetical protein KK1_036920 [Cajanus cajan]